MVFTGIHHVSILVSSEKVVDFYKKLGFAESYRKIRKKDFIVLLDGHGMQLEVFVDSTHPICPQGENEPLGLRHFALKTDNIEKTIEQLKKIDVIVGDVGDDWKGLKYCYLVDPDGGLVEIHE